MKKFLTIITIVILFFGFGRAVLAFGSSNGLVGYWTMDSRDISWTTGTVIDRSGGGYTGSFAGSMGTTSAPAIGKMGQALKFDGVNDYITMGTNAYNCNTANGCTISLWYKTKGVIASGALFHTVTANENRFGVSTTGIEVLTVWYNGSTSYGKSGSNGLNPNGWNHVVAIKTNASNAATLYVNGIFQSGTTAPTTSGTVGTRIGIRTNDSSTPFNGSIDDVRIYNRALTPSEILALYNSGKAKVNAAPSQNSNGLVGWWTMDNKDISWTADTVIDRSGQDRTGYITNMSTSSAPAVGKIGQALKFDGVNDYITAGTAVLNYDNTVSLWFKTKTARTLIGLSASSNVLTISTALNTTNRILVQRNTNNYIYSTDGVTVTDNQWHHLVVYNATDINSVNIYIDGVLRNSAKATSDSPLTINSFFIGSRRGVGLFFNGSIDDVRIYNHALNPSEILALYNSGKAKVNAAPSQNSNGLVGWWTMDNKDISWTAGTITDRSGSGYTGSFAGSMGTTSAPAIGKVGQALKFDGSNDAIYMGDNFDFNGTQSFSMSFWMKPYFLSGQWQMIAGKSSGSTDGYTIGIHPTNFRLYFNLWDNASTGNNNFLNNTTIKKNVWYHVVAVRNAGGTDYIYLNGVQDGSTSDSGYDLSTAVNFNVGYYSGATAPYFNGLIDDVRVYNRALTPAEITALYNAGRSIMK